MSTENILKIIESRGSGKSGPRKTGNPALDKFATALWVGEEAKHWYDKARNAYLTRTTWTVKVDETDPAFPVMQQWLLDNLPKSNQKNVTAATKTVYVDSDARSEDDWMDEIVSGRTPDRGKASQTKVTVSLNEMHDQTMTVSGHKVRVRVSPRQQNEEGGPNRNRGRAAIQNGMIHFSCRSLEAQQAVVEMLDNLVGGTHKRKPTLWVADGWGTWRAHEAPARKLRSVVLGDGVKEDLMEDLQKFLDDEKRYGELGIPWHRGYLFHGPAGTGKTSLIKALAAELGLDLWYIPLGDLKEDSSLVDLVRSVRPRGILLLEDVDAYSAARDRESDKEAGTGVSTSALLNALDGVITPHGLITIMTTNHIEKLDPALIRSGRADRSIELGLPGWREVESLWDLFFPDSSGMLGEEPCGFLDAGISQASVSEIFKRNWDYPDKARVEFFNRIGGDIQVM